MPYMKVDVEMYDEIAGELEGELEGIDIGPRPSGGWEYQTAEAKFKPEKCTPAAREILALLKSEKATGFKVCYDGGYDEGFSHPDKIIFSDREESAEAFCKRLTRADVSARIREAIRNDRTSEYYAKASDDMVIKHALDDLAHGFASLLLGNGYGTGEYQLYGEFTADLASGQIIDHEDARKPSSME